MEIWSGRRCMGSLSALLAGRHGQGIGRCVGSQACFPLWGTRIFHGRSHVGWKLKVINFCDRYIFTQEHMIGDNDNIVLGTGAPGKIRGPAISGGVQFCNSASAHCECLSFLRFALAQRERGRSRYELRNSGKSWPITIFEIATAVFSNATFFADRSNQRPKGAISIRFLAW
jgi:hypothetical protein